MKAIRNIFVKNEIAKMVRHSKNQFILLCLVFALLIIALNQSIFGLQKINQKYNNPFANYIQGTKIFFRTVEKQAENRKSK